MNGYDVANDEYTDLVKAGIVDPTKVTRSALQTPRPSRACCSPPKHWSRRFLKRKNSSNATGRHGRHGLLSDSRNNN